MAYTPRKFSSIEEMYEYLEEQDHPVVELVCQHPGCCEMFQVKTKTRGRPRLFCDEHMSTKWRVRRHRRGWRLGL